MLDDILEFVLEIVLDGMLEAAGSKKVPMPVRILLGGIVSGIILGIFALLLVVGIHSGSWLLCILAVALMASAVAAIIVKSRKFKKDSSGRE